MVNDHTSTNSSIKVWTAHWFPLSSLGVNECLPFFFLLSGAGSLFDQCSKEQESVYYFVMELISVWQKKKIPLGASWNKSNILTVLKAHVFICYRPLLWPEITEKITIKKELSNLWCCLFSNSLAFYQLRWQITNKLRMPVLSWRTETAFVYTLNTMQNY